MKNCFKLLALIMVAMVVFTACGGGTAKEEPADKTEVKEEIADKKGEVIKIGASPVYLEVCHAVEKTIEEKFGYEMEVVAFNDVNQPNHACFEGAVDGTLHQHRAFMDAYNDSNGTDLIFVTELLSGFLGIYSDKYNSLDEFPQNARIGIYEDASNLDRSLVFARDLGMITLKEKADGSLYNLTDIDENPKNFEFVQLDRPSLIKAISELDASFNNASNIVQADMDPMTYIEKEKSPDKKYAAGLVINQENEGKEWVDDFNSAFNDSETLEKINELFKGAYVFFNE